MRLHYAILMTVVVIMSISEPEPEPEPVVHEPVEIIEAEPEPEPDPVEVEEIGEPAYIEPEPEPEPEPIDYQWEAFVSATWRLETGNGTSTLWQMYNNPGGIKCGTEYCHYASKDEGMAVLKNLLQDYVDKYGYDFKAIRERYCQCGPQDYPIFMEIYHEELNKLGG